MKAGLESKNYNKLNWITKNYKDKSNNFNDNNIINSQLLEGVVDNCKSKIQMFEHKCNFSE